MITRWRKWRHQRHQLNRPANPLLDLAVARTMFQCGNLTPQQYVKILLAYEPLLGRAHR